MLWYTDMYEHISMVLTKKFTFCIIWTKESSSVSDVSSWIEMIGRKVLDKSNWFLCWGNDKVRLHWLSCHCCKKSWEKEGKEGKKKESNKIGSFYQLQMLNNQEGFVKIRCFWGAPFSKTEPLTPCVHRGLRALFTVHCAQGAPCSSSPTFVFISTNQ